MFGNKQLLIALTATALVAGTSAQAAALWTPGEITTTMWFDAEDGTYTNDTGGISQWDDMSGNGFHVTQSQSNRRPDLDASGWSNGNNQFNFTQYSANTARKDTLGRNVNGDNISGTAFTLFLVVNPDGIDTEEWPHNANISTVNGNKENRHQINSNGVKVRSDSSNGGSGTAAFAGGEQFLQFTLDSTASEVRRNGTQVASNSGTFVGGTLINDFTVNGRNSGDGHAGMTGDMGEFIYLNYNPSEEDRQLIEGYLAWKWGLEGSLDNAHPYKNAAPLIPEPSSLALLGLGGLLIARRRRG